MTKFFAVFFTTVAIGQALVAAGSPAPQEARYVVAVVCGVLALAFWAFTWGDRR